MKHIPVLTREITNELLTPILNRLVQEESQGTLSSDGAWLLDGTFGGGGHTLLFLSELEKHPSLSKVRVVALDQDPHAIEEGKRHFASWIQAGRLELLQGRWSEQLPLKNKRVYGALADLGYSSLQLEDASRGLSFQKDGPLDMRLNPSQGKPCWQWLEELDEAELAEVLWRYGDERFSKRIARAIKSAPETPKTVSGLNELILRGIPARARHQRLHASTRSFQALRILVNDELAELDAWLKHVILSLEPGGRVGILSFQSIEDRKVKALFRETAQKSAEWRLPFRKPLQAQRDEVLGNPRSRSAKLRTLERLGN